MLDLSWKVFTLYLSLFLTLFIALEEVSSSTVSPSASPASPVYCTSCSGCPSASVITITPGATSVGGNAFYGCSSLKSVVISSGVTSIQGAAFAFSSLTSITFPDGLISIDDNAFYSCTGLTTVIFPSSVTSIGNSVFSQCSSLVCVSGLSAGASVGGYAFAGCPLTGCPKPTSQPSGQPSNQPTSLPSLPSSQPTNRPSGQPSCLPTSKPSQRPSMQPSSRPSRVPSMQPSCHPSDQPSGLPSCQPSCQPTVLPSGTPSGQPSSQPSSCPTFPTAQPSKRPSSMPTVVPSCQPSVQPSCIPTCRPTGQPSGQPSQQPSCQPSSTPSMVPSAVPSCLPTSIPSIQPSSDPSMQPFVSPTRQPTDQPSAQPIGVPTSQPSHQPTSAPSAKPSLQPTAQPMSTPTSLPTVYDGNRTHATLPSNQSISVIGSQGDFKILLPYSLLSYGPFGDAFSDIILGRNHSIFCRIYRSGTDSASRLVTYKSAGGFDAARRSVAILKDFNDDGWKDIVIGDPFNGKCYVLFGSSEGFVSMNDGFTIHGESDSDLTGWSVSDAGDFNHDNVSDLVIGAPNARRTGAVYIVYGKAQYHQDVYLSNLTETHGIVLFGTVVSDFYGISVANAGDVNNDTVDDVIIGAVMTSSFYCGAAYIVCGRKTSHSPLTIHKLSGIPFMFAGSAVSAAGDINHDGVDDALVSTAPSKLALSAVTFVVFGSTALSDLLLTSMNPSQGTRVPAGGIVAHQGSNVIVIDIPTAVTGGIIAYSNSTELTLNPIPSLMPTMAPSAVPTVRPSRLPSVKPTIRPSRLPTSLMPSAYPVVEIRSNSPSISQSVTPSVIPSMEPSESPTLTPSAEPSETPSVHPSEGPTCVPSSGPSFSHSALPSSGAPTMEVSRAPFRFPTLLPSRVKSEESVVIDHSMEYNRTMDHYNVRYFVNATGKVKIDPSDGSCMYVIVPGNNLTLWISRFNASGDLIDLTLFSDIHQYSDVIISSVSLQKVTIVLPTYQTITIMDISHSLSVNNFILGSRASEGSQNVHSALIIAMAVFLVSLIVITVGIVSIYRYYGSESKEDEFEVKGPREIGYYYTDLNGQYIFEFDDVEADIDKFDRKLELEEGQLTRRCEDSNYNVESTSIGCYDYPDYSPVHFYESPEEYRWAQDNVNAGYIDVTNGPTFDYYDDNNHVYDHFEFGLFQGYYQSAHEADDDDCSGEYNEWYVDSNNALDEETLRNEAEA